MTRMPLRIVVFGNSGSGKSTLSRLLADHYHISVLHIDHYIWSAGWQPGDLERFAQVHESWLTRPAWIIDGIGPWTQLLERLDHATHAIHLDLPIATCVQRAYRRMEEERDRPNPYVADGCVYSWIEELQMRVIQQYHAQIRPKLVACLQKARCFTLESGQASAFDDELSTGTEFIDRHAGEPGDPPSTRREHDGQEKDRSQEPQFQEKTVW